jgi:hypothetical protein
MVTLSKIHYMPGNPMEGMLLGNKSGLGDMHTNKRKIKDTRFYMVQQKLTFTEHTRTQLTL